MTIAYTVFKSNLYSFDHLHEMTMYCGISITSLLRILS